MKLWTGCKALVVFLLVVFAACRTHLSAHTTHQFQTSVESLGTERDQIEVAQYQRLVAVAEQRVNTSFSQRLNQVTSSFIVVSDSNRRFFSIPFSPNIYFYSACQTLQDKSDLIFPFHFFW
jgi:hypothetical protein